MRGRIQMVLLTATALPLFVVLAEIGRESGTMLPENTAAFVGAGVLPVIVFPAVAVSLARSGADHSSRPRGATAADRHRCLAMRRCTRSHG
ncbi:MAG TPA: hypothetical protein VI030_03380 [Propionibacteriaceae bacterium]